jgi:hypothetical protein
MPGMCRTRRLAWVAAFCMGPFGGNERTWKPFNPILGETFELDLPSNGVRFLAEQVVPCHAAAFCCRLQKTAKTGLVTTKLLPRGFSELSVERHCLWGWAHSACWCCMHALCGPEICAPGPDGLWAS